MPVQRIIRNMEKLCIKESGFRKMLMTSDTSSLDIQLDEGINVSLLMQYTGKRANAIVSVQVGKSSTLTLMIKNELQEEFSFAMNAAVLSDAMFHLAVCDLDDGALDCTMHLDLVQAGAHAKLSTACIANAKKHFLINCVHQKGYTSGIMQNYAVVGEQGDYRMEACGQIKKGAHEAISQQTTRVLTMSEKHRSQVLPQLLIDENDVKASHATTLGQPDENQLYYLQTRGLTREQALGLLSIGYIMPITEIFADEQMHADLKNEVEMKVGLHD